MQSVDKEMVVNDAGGRNQGMTVELDIYALIYAE
jgi:hypothetical protein